MDLAYALDENVFLSSFCICHLVFSSLDHHHKPEKVSQALPPEELNYPVAMEHKFSYSLFWGAWILA